MDRESQGGSDVGRDYERDLGDEAPAALRDTAPDYLAPIDASAPVSGHSPAPVHATSPADAPEQDWSVARDLLWLEQDAAIGRSGCAGRRLGGIDGVGLGRFLGGEGGGGEQG